MQKKHLGIFVGIGAALGAITTFLALHEPTRSKIVKHAKNFHKKTLEAIKENADKIKIDTNKEEK